MKRLLFFIGLTFMVSLHAKETKNIDPTSLKALNDMGIYLRSLTEYRLSADFTFDVVLQDDQKIQVPGNLDYRVKRPNNIIAQLKTNFRKRDFIYDGKTFTIFDPEKGFFAQTEAPDTTVGLLDKLESKYGIELPLRDLIEWGMDVEKNKLITSVMRVSKDKIDNELTDHYAIRQGDVDWQIWVARGAKPLPRKMIISYNNDSARPQFSSHLVWSKLGKQDFTFKAPKGSYQIDLRPLKEEMMMQQEGNK
jgi:hypothetical protein